MGLARPPANGARARKGRARGGSRPFRGCTMLEANSQGLGHGKAFSVDWGVEGVQQLEGHLDEEKYIGRDVVAGAPVSGIDADFQVDDAAGLAVAAGDQRGAGKFVLAAAPVEDELIQGGLAHRHGRGQFPGGAFVRAPDLTMCEFTTCGTHLRI